MNKRELDLLRHGSVIAAAEAGIGVEAASEALATLTERSPEELRGAWPMVIAWGRLQHAYEVAEDLGDFEGMAKMAGLQTKMLREMY